ncbi:MAG: protein kinase [Polyangiaceae bacterium]|nr:protein kinase [Polyangiaceae bacterium]
MKAADLASQDEPFVLDRYQIIGQIASGGMASVSLGRLQGVGGFLRFVAIKRLHPHLALEPEFVEMFLDEARLAAKIHHQNVVPILEIGESDGHYHIVMEYIEGATLGRLMGRAIARELPVARPVLLRIVVDALSGLQAAHQACDELGKPLGIVHRDVSPQNILIGTDGCTRITDFGVARATARLANTRAGSMKGKLAYMAPEQTKGENLDLRADLFAMGIVFWEVLAARRLFRGQSEAQTLAKVLIDPIPRLKSVVPDIHPALDEVAARALDRDPDKRFQTAAQMADAIERAARVAEWGRSSMLAQSEAPEAPPIATVRDVAALVAEVCGDELSSQREAVRSWLAATPSTTTGVRPPPASRAPVSARLSSHGAPMPSSGRGEAPPEAARSSESTLARPPRSRAVRPPPATNRAWPPADADDDADDAAAELETVAGATPPPVAGALGAPADGVPSTFRSPGLGSTRRSSGKTVAWVLVVAALLGGGAVLFFKLRSGASDEPRPTATGSASAPAEIASGAPAPSATAQPSAPPTASAGDPTAVAAPSAAAPAPSASVPRDTQAPSAPRAPTASAVAPAPPAPSAPKKPSEVEDLKNPYR